MNRNTNSTCKRFGGVVKALVAGAAIALAGVAQAEELVWYTSYADAVSQAKQTGRLIFFIGGRTSCGLTAHTMASCEDESVSPTLTQKCVLWFCNFDTQYSDFKRYSSGLSGGVFPLTCIIAPNTPTTYKVRTIGPLEPDEILDLLKKAGSSSSSKKVTVTFNANGGDLSESKKLKVGGTLGTLPSCTRKGYTFKGWYTKKSGGTRVSATTKVTAKVTYYAQWTANKYKIVFNANGGKGTMKALSATYGTSLKLTANAFKRTNYKFLGWAKSKGATEAKYKNKASVKNLTSTSGKTVTLYAVWQRKK